MCKKGLGHSQAVKERGACTAIYPPAQVLQVGAQKHRELHQIHLISPEPLNVSFLVIRLVPDNPLSLPCERDTLLQLVPDGKGSLAGTSCDISTVAR